MDMEALELLGMNDGCWDDYLIAYHITPRHNIDSILQNGLKAMSCRATQYNERRAAVYLFGSKQDAFDVALREFLFGDDKELVVLRVVIPQEHYHMLRNDGLFNMSAVCSDGSYPTAVQYLDSIPAHWIRCYE